MKRKRSVLRTDVLLSLREKILEIFSNLTLRLHMYLTAECNKKNECLRKIAGVVMKENRPLFIIIVAD